MAKNKKEQFNKGEVIIYETSKKEVDLKVRFENESVWLRQNQIATLFNKDRTVITKHINKIFKDEEVDKESNVQKMHIADSDKHVAFYSLDIILAVGYRTNSKNAVKFRQWATNILKEYLLKGCAINQERLLENQKKFLELQETINFLSEKAKKKNLAGQEIEILDLLKNYSKSLTLLEKYDKNRLKISKGKKEKRKLNFDDCLEIIEKLKQELTKKKEASDIFGNMRDGSFEGIIKGIYQTFSGQDLQVLL